MKHCQVIIVSESPLFADATSRLLSEKGLNIVASVNHLREINALDKIHAIDAVIVDADDAPNRSEITMPILDVAQKYRVILLSMSNNQMTVYACKRVQDVTPADLVDAVCAA